jgi:predicted secreted protein
MATQSSSGIWAMAWWMALFILTVTENRTPAVRQAPATAPE